MSTSVMSKACIHSISSKRIMIRYFEDGGLEKDGVIEIRPDVEDLSLGDRIYAQVRIGVDGTRYLKGMAIYCSDPSSMPPGIDLIFNTSASRGTPIADILKPINKNSSNPFSVNFRQWSYQDADGISHLSPLNIVADNNDWDEWVEKQRNLAAQFISRKNPTQSEYSSDSSCVDYLCQKILRN